MFMRYFMYRVSAASNTNSPRFVMMREYSSLAEVETEKREMDRLLGSEDDYIHAIAVGKTQEEAEALLRQRMDG